MDFKSTMLVDYRLLIGEIFASLRVIKELNPGETFEFPDILDLLFTGLAYLHEDQNIDVYIYHGTDEESEVEHLNGLTETRDETTIRITTVSNDYFSVAMAEDIERKAAKESIILVVGDDPIYEPSILDSLDKAEIKLLRRHNDETTYDEVRSLCRYQDIHYAVGTAMGLPMHMM